MSKLKFPFFGKLLVEAICEFDKLDVYDLYDNFKYFQVLVPGYSEPFTGSILGFGGDFYGFNLYVGKSGFEMYRSFCDDPHDLSTERLRKLDMYSWEMLTDDELADENRKWLKAVGVKVQPYTYYPDFVIYRPGKVRGLPGDKEVAVMLYAVKGMLKAIREGKFEPSDMEDAPGSPVFTIKTSGKPADPQIEILNLPAANQSGKPSPLPEAKPAAAATAVVDDAAAIDLSPYQSQSFGFRSLPRVRGQWVVRSFCTGAVVGEDLQSILAVIDLDNGPRLFDLFPSEHQDDPVPQWELLSQMLKGVSPAAHSEINKVEPALPDELIFFCPQLCRIASAVLSPLQIKCTLYPIDSEIYALTERLAESLRETFALGPAGAFNKLKDELPKDVRDKYEDLFSDEFEVGDSLPADDDFKGWVKLNEKLKDKIYDAFETDKRFKANRPLKTYFGDIKRFKNIEDYPELFKSYSDSFIVESYSTWFAAHYRAQYNSDTLIEKWIEAKDTAPVLVHTIKQFSSGINSIFKLDKIRKTEGKVVFIDMIDSRRRKYEIIDFVLANTAQAGLYIPAKIYFLGDYNFFWFMGPVIEEAEYEILTTYYEGNKVDLANPNLFDNHAYLFGWIWRLYAAIFPPQSVAKPVNSDGDALSEHQFLYRVDDEKAAREKLKNMSCIDYDESNDVYLWFRPDLFTPRPADAGDASVTLGFLRFHGSNLIVEVNSEKRYNKCRKWLDRVEGLHFMKAEVLGNH